MCRYSMCQLCPLSLSVSLEIPLNGLCDSRYECFNGGQLTDANGLR